jgi:L-type amino acid transporter 9
LYLFLWKGALAFAELSILIPKNGGEFIYLYESMKGVHPFFGPLPAFLFVWVRTLVVDPAALTIFSLMFAKYLMAPFWSGRGHADGNLDSQRVVECVAAVDQQAAAGLNWHVDASTRLIAATSLCA